MCRGRERRVRRRRSRTCAEHRGSWANGPGTDPRDDQRHASRDLPGPAPSETPTNTCTRPVTNTPSLLASQPNHLAPRGRDSAAQRLEAGPTSARFGARGRGTPRDGSSGRRRLKTEHLLPLRPPHLDRRGGLPQTRPASQTTCLPNVPASAAESLLLDTPPRASSPSFVKNRSSVSLEGEAAAG